MGHCELRRPVLVASNVLLSQSGEILLGLRSDNLKWATPGGKVEDESVVEASRREQREESEMELRGAPICLGYSDSWDIVGAVGLPWHVYIFLLWQSWEGFPRLVEDSHLQWRWFPLNQLPPLDMVTPGTRVLLSSLLPNYMRIRVAEEKASDPNAAKVEFLPDSSVVSPWCDDFHPRGA
jgi:ADP-ribose pyrophosphatase YjhB (NUDIX family)